MNPSTLATAALWSYGIATAGYVAFTLRVALGGHGSVRAKRLIAATSATALWAAVGIMLGVYQSPAALFSYDAVDALRYGAWFLFLAKLLEGSGGSAPDASPETARGSQRWWIGLIALALVASVLLSPGWTMPQALGLASARATFGVRLGIAVIGLMLVEQLLRRVPAQLRWGVRPLCVGLAGTFGFDLFFFADAMLFGRPDVDIWVARAVANAMVIPFIAVSTARNTGWSVEMHISRGVVFHTTALFVSGVFLLVVAGAGYFIRYFGGDWGAALSIELVFAAVLLGVLVAGSGRFRAWLKVFVSKHFFSYRYDYREEWLRFTRTLNDDSTIPRVHERVIMALANLIESPGGTVWLADETRGFVPAARWNMPATDGVEPNDGALPAFLRQTGWVINLEEYESTPWRYAGLALPSWLGAVPGAWLIVPLDTGSELLGFVVLTTPRTPIEVDWEVHDLLKTASRQAASYLGEIRASEALLEARKFDAFNRMSAFVVHDLKNLVAQLSLMLKNAERHRDNPDFQRDMLSTVEHVVERMNGLMLQLRAGSAPVERQHAVDLESAIRRVCAAKKGAQAAIELDLRAGVTTLGDQERLEHVIGHLVQNALDATAHGGRVEVRLDRDGRFARIEVLDTGVGMSAEFIRERLFKPFETTKAAGMGIGVYESAQYVSGLGGQILVDSEPRGGTRVRVLLPIPETAAQTADREAA